MTRPLRLLVLCSALIAAAEAQAEPRHDKRPHAQPGHAHPSAQPVQGPVVDVARVLAILADNRSLIGPASDLPPGIRKNLARGKPLPPGIAKQLDSRLLGRLPRYDDHEWKQVGADLVLVAVATGIVIEILNDVLD
ncbi:hypothetical protein HKW98_13045 [Stutzerimonas urumqiensis]|uniref:anti-virulence regulator CigR family protein n=1 Tax=Stutzerimonas urumqiensis TaxID=638269 RepID=UPI003BAB4583